MHIIDGIFVLMVLVGCFYGVMVGPFVALLSIVGVISAGPILYMLHPHVFLYLPEYKTDLIAHLIYFPLGYLLLIFSFKALALKLDSLTKKLWPVGKRIWGGVIGSTLASFFWISIIVLTYPFLKELTQYSFPESKLWTFTDSFCSEKPELYLELRELVSLDDFKKVMKSSRDITIPQVSEDFQINLEESENQDKPNEVDVEKILSDQEDASAKQKLLYEFLQKYLVKHMESESATKKSSV